MILYFLFKDMYVNGKRIINTAAHLQNDNEIGGKNSTPPLATTKFEAIKIGWINSNDNAMKLFFLGNFYISIFYRRKLRKPS